MPGLSSFPSAPADAKDMVTDIHELIAILPADCAPIAVYSYLARTLRQARGPQTPVKATIALIRDARLLHTALSGWDGDLERLTPTLGRAVEAVADCIAAAADIAIHRAETSAAPLASEQLADNTAGAYDAVVGASKLLTPSPAALATA